MRKPIVIMIVGAALLGVLGLCALTAIGAFRWLFTGPGRVTLDSRAGVHAETLETHSFPADEASRVEIFTAFGDINITAAEGDTVEVEILREAWAEDEAAAQEEAEALPVEISQGANGLTLAYRPEETRQLLNRDNETASQVSFTLRLPPETPLVLEGRSGEIRASGVRAGLEVDGGFGTVSIRDVAGELSISSSSGNIELLSADAGDSGVLVEAGFGSLTLEDIEAASLTLSGESGRIELRRIETAGPARVDTEFGDVLIENVRAEELKVESRSGRITVEQGQIEGPLDLTGGFGNLEVSNVAARSYRLASRSGLVRLEGGQGEISIETGFGDIVIEGAEEATLNLKSDSGSVRFSGSLAGSQPHSLEAGFGDIELAIPAGTALDLDLEANIGEISSSLPVTMNGEMNDKYWQGTLNGGGTALTAKTRSGKIRLLSLGDTAP